jgi:hypothetical protein
MKMFRFSVVLLLWLTGVSAHALEWKEKEISIESAPGARAADAVFTFENKGKEPVTIITITTSCACTTATADKMTYGINDSGKISVHFDFEGRTGKQQRTILVLAWENGEQIVTKLTLDVTIGAPVETQFPKIKLDGESIKLTISFVAKEKLKSDPKPNKSSMTVLACCAQHRHFEPDWDHSAWFRPVWPRSHHSVGPDEAKLACTASFPPANRL